MSSLPSHQNRVLLAVDALKGEIRDGELVDELPGERALALRLRASRKTLRKALDQLELEGWISAAVHGKRREILFEVTIAESDEASFPMTQKRTLQGKTVCLMAPLALDQMSAIERFFQSRLTRMCEQDGLILRHRSLDVRQMQRPGYRLQQYVRQNPADIYLLQHASRPIQQWFKNQDVPSLVLGSSWDEIELPAVSVDMAATAVHSASMLSRYGHQRIAMFYPNPASCGLETFITKFAEVAPGIELVLIKYEENPESIRVAAQRVFQQSKALPTAILTPSIHSTISVLSAAGQHGVMVPQDLTLLCLAHDSLLDYTHPAIAGYQFDWNHYAKLAAQKLCDLILHPESKSLRAIQIIPQFIAGESLGKLG